MRESARQGYFPGSRPPFGYRVEKVEVRPGVRRSKLIIDGTEAATLRELFSLYLGGLGAIQVAETLNARGVACRGARRWTKDRVLRVVSDRAATGTYLWARGEEEPVEIRVPAVLESETFERAVALRDRIARPRRGYPQHDRRRGR